MSRRARWIVVAAFIAASSASVAVYAWTRAATRANRWQRGETEVQTLVPTGLTSMLYRAGDTLTHAVRVGFAANAIWLSF